MDDKTNKVLSISSALLLRALIGTGIGMLTAPRSGEATRSLIREKSLEMKEKASSAVTDTRDRAGRAFDGIAMSTRERIPSFKHQAEQMAEEASQKVRKGS